MDLVYAAKHAAVYSVRGNRLSYVVIRQGTPSRKQPPTLPLASLAIAQLAADMWTRELESS
jgi:hypothetical protein